MIIAAFDPGVRNFAFGVENIDEEYLPFLDLESIYLCGETIFCSNNSLENGETRTVTALLDQHSDLWERCDVVLVEKQMQFKNVINTQAIRIAHHCMSYFELKYPHLTVVHYASTCKTRVLGAPPKMTKPQRKKWSTETAARILSLRGDVATLAKRDAMTCKLDDISDCMLMCISYMVSTYGNKKLLKRQEQT